MYVLSMTGGKQLPSQWRRKYPGLPALSEQFCHDFAGDISQAKIPALETVSQARMIEAEKVQHGRVEIVDVNRVLHNPPPQFIRLANRLSAFDTRAGHPVAESERMMVTPGDAGKRRTIVAERC